MARAQRLTIPTRIVLGFLVVLLAFGAVAVLSFIQHNRTTQTLESLEDGYLPLALTLGTAKATQAVYANLVDRVLEDDRTARTRRWLRAALRVRPTTLRRAYEGLERVESLRAGQDETGALAAVRRSLDRIAKAHDTLDAQYDELFAVLDGDSANTGTASKSGPNTNAATRSGVSPNAASKSGAYADAVRKDGTNAASKRRAYADAASKSGTNPTSRSGAQVDAVAERPEKTESEPEDAPEAIAKDPSTSDTPTDSGDSAENTPASANTQEHEEQSAVSREDASTSAEDILARIRATEQQVERRYQAAWSLAQQEISRVSRHAAEQQRRGTMFLGLLGLLALVVGIAVTWLSQRVLRPIPLLHKRVAEVARGDLSSAELPVASDDELGQLVAEFERMVKAIAARDAQLREAALAERRLQRMQVQIVEALRAAVVLIDADQIVRNVNPAAEPILGLRTSDVGRAVDQTSLFRRFRSLKNALHDVLANGAPVFLESEQITGFDEKLVDVLATPFGDDTDPDELRGLLLVADDVTEAAATKSRLIQTERLAAIGRMAAHVTHEVRNPLSSIGLNVDLLKDEMASDESRALIESIQREVDRLESITEEYLRLARLPQPSLHAEDPGIFLRSVAEFVRREMDAAGVRLQLDIGAKLPEVAMDDAQLRQALLNLLRNAREAMPDGGTVKLNAGRYEGGVRIEVHDEGAGVDVESREHVFDLFYTTKERGTGLGLPLTRQIVAAHGGTIDCRDRLPHGTTFVVWLPAASTAMRETPVLHAV